MDAYSPYIAMILFLKDNGGEFRVDLSYDLACEWSQVRPEVDRELYDFFTYQEKKSFMERMKRKVSLGSREWMSLRMLSERAEPSCIAKQSNKRQCFVGVTGSMPLTSFLDIWEDCGPVSFTKVVCELMRDTGVSSISVYSPFHHESVLLFAICTTWSENTFTDLWGSSVLVHLFDSAFFLVGVFHTFLSSLFFCPLTIACFSVIHLTAMMDFKNRLLILTSRTQPRTLNFPP